jgi:hypothetical protein
LRYVCSVPMKRGTHIRTYVAEITGEHPVYGFQRNFIGKTIYGYHDKREYEYELGEWGIFEQGITRLAKGTNEVLERERRWFVLTEKSIYEIEREDVLFCLFNLNRQYSTGNHEEEAN